MADPSTYKPSPGSVPDAPGVYRFSDDHARVIYVGKAKSLRSRLGSYFQDIAHLHPRTRTMVQTASRVEWTVVETEVEALQLEYTWIKEFDPRFNVRYRDDKSYPSLAVTLNEEFPRLMVMRGPKRKGVRYFGPYAHAWAIRETLDLLLRVFPARTCSAGVFKRSAQVGRPCLLGYIGKCSAPCVGRVSPDEHRDIVEDFCDFMAGSTGKFLKRLEREMRAAADDQEYERAARLRDDMQALERAMEKNAVVLADGTDADVIAIAEDSLEAAVQLFYVRGGRIRGQRGWVADKVEDISSGDLVEHFLVELYGDRSEGAVPREVLVPALPDDPGPMTEWLEQLRQGRVDLRVPQRGDKRALMETVGRNARQALVLHKTRRASDLTTRSQALEEIQESLQLSTAPLRIEAYDISNLQGENVVASMVVFEDGLARKSEYRRFVIRGLAGDGHADDVRSIYEVITRRFKRLLDEQVTTGPAGLDAAVDPPRAATPVSSNGSTLPRGPDGSTLSRSSDGSTLSRSSDGSTLSRSSDGSTLSRSSDGSTLSRIDPETGRLRKFAYPPQLVVVDGGAPQVAAAQRALDELGIDDVALCGLAKRLEEVWLPGEDLPVILPRTSEGLYLLQRVRDEAHRFAIAHHRERRSKSMTASVLDDVAGLGETRRKALLRHFGSLKRLREATAEEIAVVPGIGPLTAAAVVNALTESTSVVARRTVTAIDTSTGEIIEEPA